MLSEKLNDWWIIVEFFFGSSKRMLVVIWVIQPAFLVLALTVFASLSISEGFSVNVCSFRKTTNYPNASSSWMELITLSLCAAHHVICLIYELARPWYRRAIALPHPSMQMELVWNPSLEQLVRETLTHRRKNPWKSWAENSVLSHKQCQIPSAFSKENLWSSLN